MNIDWHSLLLVAITTVVAAIAIVGIFSLGVLALTGGNRGTAGSADAGPAEAGPAQVGPGARLAGYACIGISALLVLYGLYLVVPQFH
jgi:hypothetical protein